MTVCTVAVAVSAVGAAVTAGAVDAEGAAVGAAVKVSTTGGGSDVGNGSTIAGLVVAAAETVADGWA